MCSFSALRADVTDRGRSDGRVGFDSELFVVENFKEEAGEED